MPRPSSIRTEMRGHVAVITLDRPARLNALSKEDLVAFGETCRMLRETKTVRAVVITGAGRGFCSGVDTRETDKASGDSVFVAPTRVMGTPLDFITPLIELGKPTIAAVNGVAVGAGLGMALACDIRLMGKSGALFANFNAIGFSATDGVPYLLPRLVGVSRALQILYLDERIDADAALAMGLASDVVNDDLLLDEALAMADKIAAAPPVAVQMTRQAVLAGLDRPWREAQVQQELAYLSTVAFGADDIVEARAASQARREGVFHGVLPVSEGRRD